VASTFEVDNNVSLSASAINNFEEHEQRCPFA